MVYYFSLAGDQERINCLRPEDEIADLPNWFACGEFDNMEAAEQALFPLGLFDAQGCANYTLADGVAQAGGGDTAELEKQLEAANARADEADKRLANIKAYVAEV